MGKRAVLRFIGNLNSGFQVLLDIRSELGATLTEASGELPALPKVSSVVESWRGITANA